MNWLRENWLQLHLAFVPIGTLAATWLLWISGGDGWQWWNNRADMEQMGQMAPLGAAVYGSLILVIEGVVRMFWALSRILDDIEKRRQQRQEALKEGREELIRELVEQNVQLPPEILAEVKDHPNEPPKS